MKDMQIITDYMKARSKKEKEKKHKKKGKRKHFSFFKNPEKIFKGKEIKRLYKEDMLEEELMAGMDCIGEALGKMYNNKGKLDKDDVIDALDNKKFFKSFSKALKEMVEDGEKISDGVLFMISELYLSKTELEDDDALSKLIKIFSKAKEEEIEEVAKLFKKAGYEKKSAKQAALKLSLITQGYKGCRATKTRMYRFLKELYSAFDNDEKINEKTIKKILKIYYGKNFPYFALMVLEDNDSTKRNLNTPEQKEVYSLVTNIVLRFIEKMDNDNRRELLKKYAKYRENSINIKRRVNLYNLNDDDYGKILKTVHKLIRHGYRKEIFE